MPLKFFLPALLAASFNFSFAAAAAGQSKPAGKSKPAEKGPVLKGKSPAVTKDNSAPKAPTKKLAPQITTKKPAPQAAPRKPSPNNPTATGEKIIIPEGHADDSNKRVTVKPVPGCTNMDEPRTIGRLSYMSLASKDGACVVSISYTHTDGIINNWTFDTQGKMLFSVDKDDNKGNSFTAMHQTLFFPANASPRIENLNTDPPTLKVTAANGSELFFDINKGEFMPNSVPYVKTISHFQMNEEITQMTGELRGKMHGEKVKYVDTTPIRDLVTVENSNGNFIYYTAKFGQSPECVRNWSAEYRGQSATGARKVCTFVSDKLFRGYPKNPDRYNLNISKESLTKLEKETCNTQDSWSKGVYPKAGESAPTGLTK